MSRGYTNPSDIQEVESLSKLYDLKLVQAGVYLLDDWLFIYPKRQKWGHRYDNAFGYYERGGLGAFVKKATEEYVFPPTYHGRTQQAIIREQDVANSRIIADAMANPGISRQPNERINRGTT